MKKKRTISIKHKKLKYIRDNFRILLLKVAQEELLKILKKIKKIEYNDHGKLKHPNDLTIEEKTILNDLTKIKVEIRQLIDKSICKCHRCIKTDQDMTYNPVDKAWYCVDCYKEMQRWTAKKKTGISVLFP